ncbi:MAG TPA: translation initiation factor IF-2 [Acidimicrobiia bacterium]|nr:translation initiation factor IF-2 [Acidimicrobiia bacterium]
MRVYELARDLGVDSKVVLEQAQALGLDVKTASSGLDEDAAELLRLAVAGDEPEAIELEPVSAPVEEEEAETEAQVGLASLKEGASVTEFAEALGVPSSEIVKTLLLRGLPVGAGQPMPTNLMEEIAESYGFMVDVESPVPAPVVSGRPQHVDSDKDLRPRPPVVTVMGHVDHGKTTLLDKIRKTSVVEGELGGITQHIGAYQVEVNGHPVTFIDTPGHEAFTALRARGANITDIVVLVVAANDGVMPQTVEAISHAKAAGVKTVVAINKIDVPGADPTRVRTELTEHNVITEELGGDVPSVEVSALNGNGVEDLLEVIDLIAQLDEYKANPDASASGVVVEARYETGRGAVATVIIQRGTLHQGDSFVAGAVAGRARGLMDEDGKPLKSAGPSDPVQIMGWDDVPVAGDYFEAVESDREARRLATERGQELKMANQAVPSARDRLQSLLDQLRTDEAHLNLIVKADAQGSLEALRESIVRIEREGGRIQIVHGAVGGINENDVTLADVTESVIVGFNVRPEPKARKAAEQAGIEIRTYGIIYEMLDDIELLLVGQLAPEEHEQVLGTAEVRAIFKVPRAGTVAGCYVVEGVIQRGARARLLRDGIIIHDGAISSLKRFKDDVREVAAGFECGMSFENYNDVKEGDSIEAYLIREVART